jgi:hypothetical protein
LKSTAILYVRGRIESSLSADGMEAESTAQQWLCHKNWQRPGSFAERRLTSARWAQTVAG